MPSKLAERLFLDQMVKDLGLSVTDVEPHDPPDFTMMLDGARVAVEVTQIFQEEGRKGSATKAREHETARRIWALRKEYYSDPNSQPIHLTVFVPKRIESSSVNQPSGEKEEACAQDVARRALARLRHLPRLSDGEQREFQVRQGDGRPLNFYVTKVPSGMPAAQRWENHGDQMGWVHPFDPAVVEAKIAAKAPRLPASRAGVSSAYLLLVADTSFASGLVYDPPPGLQLDAHRFDAVFFQRFHLSTIRIA